MSRRELDPFDADDLARVNAARLVIRGRRCVRCSSRGASHHVYLDDDGVVRVAGLHPVLHPYDAGERRIN